MGPVGGCADRRDVLPVVPKRCSDGRARSRKRKREALETVFHGLTQGCNALSEGVVCIGSDRLVVGITDPPPPNSVRASAAQFLRREAHVAICRNLFRADDAVCNDGEGYSNTTADKRVWLEPELLSLPSEGVAGTTDFLPYLADGVREMYSHPEGGLLREGSNPIVKPHPGVNGSRYGGLILKLEKGRLVELQQVEPRVVNGVFAAQKYFGKGREMVNEAPEKVVKSR